MRRLVALVPLLQIHDFLNDDYIRFRKKQNFFIANLSGFYENTPFQVLPERVRPYVKFASKADYSRYLQALEFLVLVDNIHNHSSYFRLCFYLPVTHHIRVYYFTRIYHFWLSLRGKFYRVASLLIRNLPGKKRLVGFSTEMLDREYDDPRDCEEERNPEQYIDDSTYWSTGGCCRCCDRTRPEPVNCGLHKKTDLER